MKVDYQVFTRVQTLLASFFYLWHLATRYRPQFLIIYWTPVDGENFQLCLRHQVQSLLKGNLIDHFLLRSFK